MHPRTLATLEQLDRSPWFGCVGKHDTEAAIILCSWEEAIAHCSCIEWGNHLLLATNGHRRKLVLSSKERFNQWNDVVDEVKPVVISFVQRKIDAVVRDNELPKKFEDIVLWDILHLCMEAEYADLVPPGFFASQAYWYMKGHFPCGWNGDFPNGKLIIY